MILGKILDHKRQEIAEAKLRQPTKVLYGRLSALEDKTRGFERCLRSAADSCWTAVIAEVKKGSPSKGVIRDDFDPVDIAETFETHGATCLSVLTDQRFFYGHLNYLQLIREQVSLPLLRKDFICDSYQILEARVAGADAILLIATALETVHLIDLIDVARGLSLDVLVEIHDEEDLDKALRSDCSLIGINNRDLNTFLTDLSTTERLAAKIPPERFIVTESGINSRSDINRLWGSGARAFLIGESLMRERDIGKKLDELLGQ